MKEMMNHIINEDRLKDLLDGYDLAYVSKIHDIQHYEKKDNRHGVVMDIQENRFADKTKVLIDIRQGQPIVNQVYDALYDEGKDCDIKIIVFTDGYNEYDKGVPVADEYLVSGMIGKLQDMNIPIYLFSIYKKEMIVTLVDSYQTWYQVNRFKSACIPTAEGFMAETFWYAYFDSFNEAFYEPWNAFSGNTKGTEESIYTIGIDSIFYGEIRLFWDENGVRYDIKQVCESDDYLKKLLSIYMPFLKERYGDDSVRFENVVGRLPRLYIKYSDKPFNWLYTATPMEITKFAKKMFDDAWGLRWGIEETVEKLYDKVSI
jgi:hypothetical protein